jgi:serine/threonine protein kinase
VKTRAVCSATDRRTQRNVAIKKITDAFAHATDTKRTLREAQLLRLISHENVIAIVDILPPVNVAEFDDVYVISELMAEILESQCP